MAYDDDFHAYVMECIDAEDFSPEYYSCENICTSCKFFELFGEYCPCALNISCLGYDDKGDNIVCACSAYEKKNKEVTK